MKKCVFFFFLLVVGLRTFAQSQISTINWQDFKNSINATDVTKPVKWGTFTTFKITNINKFLYKVTIAGKVFDLQTPVPSELQSLFRLSSSDLQKTATTSTTQEAANQISKDVETVSRVYSAERSARAPSDPASEFETAMNNFLNGYKTFLNSANQLSSDVLTLKRARSQLISIAQRDLSFNDITTYVALVDIPANTETDYANAQKYLTQTNLLYEQAKNAAPADNPDAKKKLDDLQADLKKTEDLIAEESLLSLVDDVNYLSDELQNENNFTVIAPPVQMDGDLISYEITITPTATKALAPYRNPMKFKFDVPTKGGLKVDFSVGPTISFGKNSKDDKYFLEETASSDTVKLRSRPNNNKIAPGIAAFMHVYSHSGKQVNVGGVFGVGAGFQNSTDINVSLHLGLSLVIGKSQKVMTSMGVSYLRVQRIKDEQFVVNKNYAVSKIELSQVTEPVFKPSVFFSISYNLSNRTEINQ